MTQFDLNNGALAPLAQETDTVALTVTGDIPAELNGVLLRNGPNPLSGKFDSHDLLSWWPEAAMFHGTYFKDGKVTRYRNKWARTRRWGHYHQSDNIDALLDTNPSINIISHAGELLALAEGGMPLAINPDLDSIGASQHEGIKDGITAHPKKDPLTGELMTFRADWNQPWLTYGVTGPNGDELYSTTIDVPAPMMMHDMAITSTHSLLFDLGVAYDFSMLEQGFNIPLRWHDNRPGRIGVIPRHGGQIQWIEIDPCFIQHISNAYNKDDTTIVVDAVRYPWYLRVSATQTGYDPNPLGVLWRYCLDLKNGTATEHAIDHHGIEFPRINESLIGQNYRYLYAAEQPTDEEIRGIVRYDVTTGSTQKHVIAAGDQNGEPVFIPRTNATTEDDGWLMVYVYRKNTDRSDLMILDASNLSAEPLALIHLPQRVPAGFHATWVAFN